MGIDYRVRLQTASGSPDLHRVSGWRSEDEFGALQRLHSCRIIFVVSCTGVRGIETGPALVGDPTLLSSVTRRNRGRPRGRDTVVSLPSDQDDSDGRQDVRLADRFFGFLLPSRRSLA